VTSLSRNSCIRPGHLKVIRQRATKPHKFANYHEISRLQQVCSGSCSLHSHNPLQTML